MNLNSQKTFLILVILGIAGTIWYFEAQRASTGRGGEAINIEKPNKAEKAKMYEPAIELTDNQSFINSPVVSLNGSSDEPFKLADFIGKKVILIDFWTYSCINCQRTIPYLNSWWEKYNDKGLLIVGVHTPEFEFEKDRDNVVSAVEKFGIKYPVVQDNNYSTWRAYGNRYWPRKYLIDIDGFIVYDHIGEGAYEETEMKIQELLNERIAVLGEEGKISDTITKEQRADSRAGSPEIYFGSSRNNDFGSGQSGRSGVFDFSEPLIILRNTLYLSGRWELTEEYAKNVTAGSKIIFKYSAKEVFFVAEGDQDVAITVLQDGRPVGSSAGDDISEITSEGNVGESRLYRLINNDVSGEHILEIIIKEPGLKAFTFTFG